MSYNENRAQHIRTFFQEKKVDFYEKRMFSGLVFMVDDKMCCGTHIDKVTQQDFLLCRLGEEAYVEAVTKEDVIPMEFTGKPMKGYVFVTESGHNTTKALTYWLQLCLDFNPLAKASKKK